MLAASLLGSCGNSGPAVGAEKGDCFPNGTCNRGLTCFSNICVKYGDGGSAGAGGTAGAGAAGTVGGASGTSGGAGAGGQSGAGEAGRVGSAGAGGTTGAAGVTGSPGAGGSAGTTGAAGAGGAGGSSITGGAGSAVAGSSGAGGSVPPVCPANTDFTSSDTNCGSCGYSCVHGRHCVSGRCSPAWLPLSTTGAPPPTGSAAAGFIAGKFVVLGGFTTSPGVTTRSSYGYDVTADAWATLASLITARCAHEAVSTGTTILTFGGLSHCGSGY